MLGSRSIFVPAEVRPAWLTERRDHWTGSPCSSSTDNQDALDLLQATLAYYGALTFTAADGNAALQRLASMRVDVVISDISMPGFSGHDLIRAIRSLPDEQARKMPAIALTAFHERN